MVYVGFASEEEIKQDIYDEKVKNTKERWKNIYVDGHKTHYKVSNLGRVYNKKKNKYIGVEGKSTYLRVDIEGKRMSVHRLVAYYFCKIPKRYLERGLTYKDLVPNHKNGLKHCNASFNLEWVTQKENTDHAWKEGLCDSIRGENAHLAKITEETAKKIIQGIMDRKTNKQISEELGGVSLKTIQHIRSKECWRHLSKDLTFPKLAKDYTSTVSDDKIREICRMLETRKYSDPEISRITGVDRRYICGIRHHKVRKNISKEFNF